MATGGPDGMTLTSNAIPTTNSITGSFGDGLTLTGFNNAAGGGGQFLTYPKLAELMTAKYAGWPRATPSPIGSKPLPRMDINSRFSVIGATRLPTPAGSPMAMVFSSLVAPPKCVARVASTQPGRKWYRHFRTYREHCRAQRWQLAHVDLDVRHHCRHAEQLF